RGGARRTCRNSRGFGCTLRRGCAAVASHRRVADVTVFAGIRVALRLGRGGATVIKSFVLGAVIGGAAVALYGRQIAEYLEDRTFAMRMKAADGLGVVAHGVESMRETVEAVKGRIEDGFSTAPPA